MTNKASSYYLTNTTSNSPSKLPIANSSYEQNMRKARRSLFNGWLIAMIGIATYCFVLLGYGVDQNPYATIFEQGVIGNIAIVLLTTGVVLWFRGALKLLDSNEHSSTEGDSENKIH